MTPATAYLTFTERRAAQLVPGWSCAAPAVDEVVAALRTIDRAELAQRASGVHEHPAAAIEYARREGPSYILTPEGRVCRVERGRDAGLDATAAAEQTAYSERLRSMTFREAMGPTYSRGI